jgi:hypothetical protein
MGAYKMSEHVKTHENQEALPAGHHEALLRAHVESALKDAEQNTEKADVATAQYKVERAASETDNDNPFKKLEAAEEAANRPVTPNVVNTELKNITLNRELVHIRRQLPRPDRALSKVIHQPVIRAVSESASKTVTRPSGLLGGGIVAFIGTSSYVYFTKHIGVSYNYLLFVVFFVSGFALGLLLELALWLTLNRRKKTY